MNTHNEVYNECPEVQTKDLMLRVYPTNNHALTRDGEIVAGGLWTLELMTDNPEFTVDELERMARYLYAFARRERAAQEAREGWGRPE